MKFKKRMQQGFAWILTLAMCLTGLTPPISVFAEEDVTVTVRAFNVPVFSQTVPGDSYLTVPNNFNAYQNVGNAYPANSQCGNYTYTLDDWKAISLINMAALQTTFATQTANSYSNDTYDVANAGFRISAMPGSGSVKIKSPDGSYEKDLVVNVMHGEELLASGVPLTQINYPEKEGYLFDGCVDANGNYSLGFTMAYTGSVNESNYQVQDDLTLYTHYIPRTYPYPIKFHFADGTTQESTTFIDSASGAWRDADGNIVDMDTVVTAIDVYDVATCTVSYYDSDFTTLLGSEPVEEGASAQGIEVPDKPSENLTFSHWADAEGNAVSLDAVSEDVSVYAVYQESNYHTVTFEGSDNTVVDRYYIKEGNAIGALPDAPQVDGQWFVAWRVNDENVTAETIIMEDITLQAFYTTSCTLDFYYSDYINRTDGGATKQSSITTFLGDTITKEQMPAMDESFTYEIDRIYAAENSNQIIGYVTEEFVFAGWSTNTNNQEADCIAFPYEITENVSFYPIYISQGQITTYEGNATIKFKYNDKLLASSSTPYGEVYTGKKPTQVLLSVDDDGIRHYGTITGWNYDFTAPIAQSITAIATVEDLGVTMAPVSFENGVDIATYYGKTAFSDTTAVYCGHTFANRYATAKITPYTIYTYSDGTTSRVERETIECTDNCTIAEQGELIAPSTTGTAITKTLHYTICENDTVYTAEKNVTVRPAIVYSTIDLNNSYTLTTMVEPLTMEAAYGSVDISSQSSIAKFLDGVVLGLQGTFTKYANNDIAYFSPAISTKSNKTATVPIVELGYVPTYTCTNTTFGEDERGSYVLYEITASIHGHDECGTVTFPIKMYTRIKFISASVEDDRISAVTHHIGQTFSDNSSVYRFTYQYVDEQGNATEYQGNETVDVVGTLSELNATAEFSPLVFTQSGMQEITATIVDAQEDVVVIPTAFTVHVDDVVFDGFSGRINGWDYTLTADGVLTYTYANDTYLGTESANLEQFGTTVKEIRLMADTSDGTVYNAMKLFANLPTVTDITIIANQDCVIQGTGLCRRDTALERISYEGAGNVTYDSLDYAFSECASLEQLPELCVTGTFLGCLNHAGTNTLDIILHGGIITDDLGVTLSNVTAHSLTLDSIAQTGSNTYNTGGILDSTIDTVIVKNSTLVTPLRIGTMSTTEQESQVTNVLYEDTIFALENPYAATGAVLVDTSDTIGSVGDNIETLTFTDCTFSAPLCIGDDAFSARKGDVPISITFDNCSGSVGLIVTKATTFDTIKVQHSDLAYLQLPNATIDSLQLNNVTLASQTNFANMLKNARLQSFIANQITGDATIDCTNIMCGAKIIGTYQADSLFAGKTLSFLEGAFATCSLPEGSVLNLNDAILLGNAANLLYGAKIDTVTMHNANTDAVTAWTQAFATSRIRMLDWSVTSVNTNTSSAFEGAVDLMTMITPQSCGGTVQVDCNRSDEYHRFVDAQGNYYEAIPSTSVTLYRAYTLAIVDPEGNLLDTKAVRIGDDYTLTSIDNSNNMQNKEEHRLTYDTFIFGDQLLHADDVLHLERTIHDYVNTTSIVSSWSANQATITPNKYQQETFQADCVLILANPSNTFCINYYAEDGVTLLATKDYVYGEAVAKYVYTEEPIIDGDTYTYMYNHTWLERGETAAFTHYADIAYDKDLVLKRFTKTYQLEDRQYVIQGELCKSNEENFSTVYPSGIKVQVKLGDDIISEQTYTESGSWQCLGLIDSYQYTLNFIDVATDDILLQTAIRSDLAYLGVTRKQGSEHFQYDVISKGVDRVFTMNVGELRTVTYEGYVKYDDGTPIANATVTLALNGYKVDGSYTEVEATDNTYQHITQTLPDDWDRTTGPEGVTWYTLTYADWLELGVVNDAEHEVQITDLYVLKDNHYISVAQYIKDKMEEHGANGLVLDACYHPTTGQKYTVNFTTTAPFVLRYVEHLMVEDGAICEQACLFGYQDTRTDAVNGSLENASMTPAIKTVVFHAHPGSYSFYNCPSLQAVWVDSRVADDYANATNAIFTTCPKLEKFVFVNPEESTFSTFGYNSTNGMLFASGTNDIYEYLTQLYIPNQNATEMTHWILYDVAPSRLPNLTSVWCDYNKLFNYHNFTEAFSALPMSEYVKYLYQLGAGEYSVEGVGTVSNAQSEHIAHSSNLRFENLIHFDYAHPLHDALLNATYGYWYFANPAMTLATGGLALESLNAQTSYIEDLYFNLPSNAVAQSTNSYGLIDWMTDRQSEFNHIGQMHFAWTITYDYADGYSNQTLPSTYIDGWTEDGYLILPNPHKDGSGFICWKAVNDDGVDMSKAIEQYDNFSVLRQDLAYGNLTLTAQWGERLTPNIVTVTTDENGYYSFDSQLVNGEVSYLSCDTNSIYKVGVGALESESARTLSTLEITSNAIESNLDILHGTTTVSGIESIYTDALVDVDIDAVQDGQLTECLVNLTVATPTIIDTSLYCIDVVVPPDKVNYRYGETFDDTGMVVEATYKQTWSDNSITYSKEKPTTYEYDLHQGLTLENTSVLISKTDHGVTKTTTQPITVENYLISSVLDHIEIVVPPDKTTYYVKEVFEPAGMVVDATYLDTYADGSVVSRIVHGASYDVDTVTPLTRSNTTWLVSKTDGNVTKTANQPISVVELGEPPLPKAIQLVKGHLTANGKPLANVRVELHSDLSVTYTDENGYYEFKNITPEEHTLTIYGDKTTTKALAAVKVKALATDLAATNGVFQVVTSADNAAITTDCAQSGDATEYIVNCNLTIEDDIPQDAPQTPITPSEDDEEEESDATPEDTKTPPKTGDETPIATAIVLVFFGIIGLLYLYVDSRRKDEEE